MYAYGLGPIVLIICLKFLSRPRRFKVTHSLQSLFKTLDIWRIVCATLVVLSHAGQLGLLPFIGSSLMAASHHAVIIFFVISGFSVAYSADKVDCDSIQFLAARLSRIFSIAMPAILLTLLIDVASKALHPGADDLWQLNHWFAYLVFALSFSGELWFTSIHPFSNVPFWSLNYELYYYLFFAALLIKSRVIKIIAVSVILLTVGPKIALLLPCWLCGVGLFKWVKRRPAQTKTDRSSSSSSDIGIGIAILPWTLFALIYAAMNVSIYAAWGHALTQPYHSALDYSKDFLFDITLAVVFSGFLYLHWHTSPLEIDRQKTFAGKLAPLTFAIYAMHYPMLKFASEMPSKSTDFAVNFIIVLVIFTLCAAIGLILEPTRKYWQRYLFLILERIRN
jgi:peptidoglycan/LPS O-acetylase OafA/YrhL